MKLFVAVALALVAVACAIPVEPYAQHHAEHHAEHYAEPEKILRSNYEQSPDGAYKWGYETANGIVRDEVGELREALDEENKPRDVVVMKGQFSYPGPDGKPYVFTYFADETGYHVESDAIPKNVV